MGVEVLRDLTITAMTMSLSIAIVAIARWPVRKLAGPSVAYSLWLLVPCSLLVPFLPTLGHDAQFEVVRPIFQLAEPKLRSPAAPGAAYVELTLLAIWGLGFACAMYVVAHQHRRLMRSLGTISSASNGMYQSAGASCPMVLGILQPRIVLPADFAERYSPEEQSLLLMHEEVHQRRRDSAFNALATLIACVFWFNPLVHWAIRRYRLDQEISVDHSVVRATPKRGTYGAMLLNAQLATQNRLSPFVSGWSSRHPLQERLQMLKVPAPSKTRWNIGVTVVAGLLVSATQLLWSAQAPAALADDSDVTFTADQISAVTDGPILLSGNVRLTATNSAALIEFSSDSILKDAQGQMLLQGNVQLTFPKVVVKTGKALLHAGNGTIEMDEAYVIRLK